MERRKFCLATVGVAIPSLAGCANDEGDDDPETGDNGSGTGEQSEILTMADPTVTDLRYPKPKAVSTDDRQTQGDDHEFSVTIENTGMAGDIQMKLVLLRDREAGVWSQSAQEAGSYTRFFSDGERRTETFSANLGPLHEGFGFRLFPAKAEVDVRNEGAGGDVDVQLLQTGVLPDLGTDGTVIADEQFELAEGATETVPFDVDVSVIPGTDATDIELGAKASPAEISQ